MFKVLVLDGISELGIESLRHAPNVTVDMRNTMPEEELLKVIQDYDAMMVRSQTKVNATVMAAAPKLKVIGRAGVGVDNIDLHAATECGIIVINAPDGNTIATCEHTFAMLMALARSIPQAYSKTVAGIWDRKTFVGVELRNKNIGIIGMGRIGTEVSRRAKAFGMNVLAYDPFLTEETAKKLNVRLATIEEIVKESDFITVHTPLTAQTKHLLNAEAFAAMKPGVRIINCARGGIIDEQALLEALNNGSVAGAAFDVFEEEPPTNDHPFLNHPKVIVTPHLGASTVEAQENVAVDVAEQILHIFRGESFKNAVNMPAVPAEVLQQLQPYFHLAEKLGRTVGQIVQDPIEHIRIQYNGSLADVDTVTLTRYVVVGMLSHCLESINIVNALHILKTRNIKLTVEHSSISQNFTNLITVIAETKQRSYSTAGSLLSVYGERIVQLLGFPVDVALDGPILLIAHQDQPGMIGYVGTVLGETGVNIATMQVGRKETGGSAMMVLSTDKIVPDSIVNQLLQRPEILSVTSLTL